MVERGRHRWLRGGEIAGYEGILARHATVKKDIDKVLWALNRISHRWDSDREPEFKRLLRKVPDLGDPEVYRRLVESSKEWEPWASALVPVLVVNMGQNPGTPVPELPQASTASVTVRDTVFYAEWAVGGILRTGMRRPAAGSMDEEEWISSGPPRRRVLLNALTSHIARIAEKDSTEFVEEVRFAHYVIRAQTLSPLT